MAWTPLSKAEFDELKSKNEVNRYGGKWTTERPTEEGFYWALTKKTIYNTPYVTAISVWRTLSGELICAEIMSMLAESFDTYSHFIGPFLPPLPPEVKE